MAVNDSNARVALEVNFISFHDDDLPGTAITDPKNPSSFVLTTGGFPQEVVVQTCASSAKIVKVSVTLNEAKEIVLEKCGPEGSSTFEILAERTLARGPAAGGSSNKASGGGPQTETFDLDPEGAGRDIRYLRLSILSGYSEFVGIHSVEAWGEESQQRIAIFQSRPEIVM